MLLLDPLELCFTLTAFQCDDFFLGQYVILGNYLFLSPKGITLAGRAPSAGLLFHRHCVCVASRTLFLQPRIILYK